MWNDANGDPIQVSVNQTRLARASGDIYNCLRVIEAFDPETKTREIYFRTLPISDYNPPMKISHASVDNRHPRIFGVQCVFEGVDPTEGLHHLYYVPDVTKFGKGSISYRLTDSFNSLLPDQERPLNEDAYSIDRDWVTWVGLDLKTGERNIYSRNLGALECGTFLLSKTSYDNSQPKVSNNTACWTGRDYISGVLTIFIADLSSLTEKPIALCEIPTDNLIEVDSPFIGNLI